MATQACNPRRFDVLIAYTTGGARVADRRIRAACKGPRGEAATSIFDITTVTSYLKQIAAGPRTAYHSKQIAAGPRIAYNFCTSAICTWPPHSQLSQSKAPPAASLCPRASPQSSQQRPPPHVQRPARRSSKTARAARRAAAPTCRRVVLSAKSRRAHMPTRCTEREEPPRPHADVPTCRRAHMPTCAAAEARPTSGRPLQGGLGVSHPPAP